MAEGDLTLEQAIEKVGPPPADIAAGQPKPLLPLSTAEVAALGTSGTQRNVPPIIGDTRRTQQALGEQPGVPFHEEGLPTWTDLMAKSRETDEAKLRYLAKKFGTENVRLNEFREPVVRIVNPETGKPEDYPMNPRKLTLNSLTGLMRFAPDTAGAILGEALAPELAGHAVVNTFSKALSAALGMEVGGAAREIGAEAVSEPLSEMAVKKPILEHLAKVPTDTLLNLGLAGMVKGGQAIKGLGVPKFLGGGGINIPNPIAGTPLVQPARPEFTKEVAAAAERNLARSGIEPELRPSERLGIPVVAMMEKYLERKPAGAAPMIAAGEKREAASKEFQNWMVDPTTLGTDEEVGRGALSAIKRTVEPLQKDVELAKFAKETVEKNLPAVEKTQREFATEAAQKALTTRQQAAILPKMYTKDIPTKGVDLAPTGDVLRTKAIAERDAFKTRANELYDKFYENPLAKQPVIEGRTLKRDVDALIKDLPKVEKTVEEPTGILGPSGKPLTAETTKTVPIQTPIRPRLEELSTKLAGGKVSINDLKQIRTDLNDAIAIGEAIPGVKEGRLKATASAVSNAITDGLKQIGDPNLSKAWKDATGFYKANVDKFTQKNVAQLFKEAEQTSSVGNSDFVKSAIANQDRYTALRSFYGSSSSEMTAFRDTARQHVLQKAVTPDGMIDGNNLVRHLEGMRDNNPQLFKDLYAGKGDALIAASDQLGQWQRNVPIEEVEKLLVGTKAANQAYLQGQIVALQNAQARLDKEFQNEVVKKFIKGDAPLSELRPDKFVSTLADAKLSDVREIMDRITREDPEMAEKVARKAVQDLLSRSRRVPTPVDTMAKLNEQPGDLISGIGISNALGKGDQLEKYKAILGKLYEPLNDYAKTELAGEERERIASGVGILAPGSAMSALVKLLKPWESAHPGKGIVREMGGLAADKVFSIFMASDFIRNWMASPYALADASGAIKVAMASQPFMKGMIEEFKDADTLAKTLSILKIASGTASRDKASGQEATLTEEEARRRVPMPTQ